MINTGIVTKIDGNNVSVKLHKSSSCSHCSCCSEERKMGSDFEFKKINQTEVNILGMLATQVGYEKGKEWLENLIDLIQDNYDYLKSELNKNIPDIIVTPLEGTYLAFLDLRKIISVNEVKTFIQDKARLAIDFGEWFGDSFKGFIRLNLATDPEIVKKAVSNIIEVYNSYFPKNN